MSASEDLESLDNKTLRAKCLEYGLPNVPITDTSKKILIKKLRAAMQSGVVSSSKNEKSRRETMHVTSTITNTEKEVKPARTSNRRTTIAAVRKEKEEIIKEPAPVTEKRRASRATPVQETSIPILSRKTAPVFLEESDFDEEFILIDDDIKQPVVTNIPIMRKSRSPSLSKSTVVTTSYKKDFGRADKVIEEEETEEEGFLEKRKEYNLSRQFVENRDKVATNLELPRYDIPKNIQLSDEKDDFPVGYKPLYPTLNFPDNLANTKSSYESSTTITKRKYGPSGLHTPGGILTSSRLHAPSSSSSKPTSAESLNISKNTHYVENSDSNVEEDDLIKEAPYLSDFAKRLSCLKAEKLDIGIKKDLFDAGDNYPRHVGRRKYTTNNNSHKGGIRDSINQLWLVLDRKYKIKRFILVVTILTAIILFGYYFYLQN